jgi:hypothetical protein
MESILNKKIKRVYNLNAYCLVVDEIMRDRYIRVGDLWYRPQENGDLIIAEFVEPISETARLNRACEAVADYYEVGR